MNTHPKNTVRWRPQTTSKSANNFYKPKMGASKMKWHFTLPYTREHPDKLLHYPDVSKITGKPINWFYSEPQDGYEGAHMFGENTLELKGMPMGRTPEYMQERLRRFFSKFGPVRHCRAEPHPLDPYQCEGTAYITFRDREASLKALKAPLKFPASLHDKVVCMKHLDTDKCNDTDYYEKAKFWNNELISLARQLYAKLSNDQELRENGAPLALVDQGLFERELIPDPSRSSGESLPGRGGIPLPRKGLSLGPTRIVPAKMAVRQRFGSWANFLAEAPFDELFRIDARKEPMSSPDQNSESLELMENDGLVVVRPRLASATQRARILTRAKMMLSKRLHEEFSVWWRAGKVPLPEYTQRRIQWWDHKPPLAKELQIMSRSKHIVKIHDERYLYRQQLTRARNAKRAERRADWVEERKRMLADKEKLREERRQKALEAVNNADCKNVLGLGPGLLWKQRHGNASSGRSRVNA